MYKVFIAAVASIALAVGGADLAFAAKGGGGGGSGKACPKPQPPDPPPPGCGRQQPAPTCELGPVFSAIDAAVPPSAGPLDTAVHDVLCALASNGINL